MRVIGLIALVILGFLKASNGQYFNNRPFPTYSLENMPDTQFTCRDKVLGGYYADLDTECQMFHICVKVAGVGVQDFRFLCPNGTAFDQDHQICADWDDVDCDATTLYYSSDNFDLYRIGSGFESKAVKYGEDEEPFALQRAETGDIRLNKEKQTQTINQQPEPRPFRKSTPKPQPKPNNNKKSNENNERDIFKGSSSGHFFNNRNSGKEYEEDYDDGQYHPNQNEDRYQSRKINRKPAHNQNSNNRNNNDKNNDEEIIPSTRRPTGFINNFAGSSYIPTTSRPKPTNSVQRQNNQNKNNNQQYNNNYNSPSQYTVSTPAPFRQTQQYNNANRRTTASKQTEAQTENYPKQVTRGQDKYSTTPAANNYNTQKYYNTQYRTKTTEPENYPSTKFENQKQKTPKKVESYSSTLPPKNFLQQKNTQTSFTSFPTTFSPRTNAGFSQINQQTTNNKQSSQTQTQNASITPTQNFNYRQTTTKDSTNNQYYQKSSAASQPQTQTTQYTQYTPTVPKVTTHLYDTTQAPKFSNRYDETQYDDNADDSREEFLSAAHSTNIANSRNELQKTQKNYPQTSTQKPRPFSLTTSKSVPPVTQSSPVTQSPKAVESKRKPKDYDYAYYDTNTSDDEEYLINTEIKKNDQKQ